MQPFLSFFVLWIYFLLLFMLLTVYCKYAEYNVHIKDKENPHEAKKRKIQLHILNLFQEVILIFPKHPPSKTSFCWMIKNFQLSVRVKKPDLATAEWKDRIRQLSPHPTPLNIQKVSYSKKYLWMFIDDFFLENSFSITEFNRKNDWAMIRYSYLQ